MENISMSNEKILFADDDPEIREVVRLLLASEGFQVDEAVSGEDFLEKLDDSYDLAILDIMMPGIDGFHVCEILRKDYSIPVLFLTARSMDSDKLMGYSAGGDDYLVKPFSYNDLILKVKSLLRRFKVYGSQNKAESEEYVFIGSHIRIHIPSQTVFYDEEEISLTDTEFRILHLLASHKKKIFSAQNIYESIWQEPFFYSSASTVMTHIRNIRRKLHDDAHGEKTIQTVWGKGYRVE